MSMFDERIRRALEADATPDDGHVVDRIGTVFLSRWRALILIVWVKMIAFELVATLGIVMFFLSESPKALVGWATLVLLMAIGLGVMFLLYWLELVRNSLMREVKRLEQRVALLGSYSDAQR